MIHSLFCRGTAMVALASSLSFAGVGIQAEIGVLNYGEILSMSSMYQQGPDNLGTRIGGRFDLGTVGLDALFGFGSTSEVKSIDSIDQYASPHYLNFGATIGLRLKLLEGDKAALSFLPRYSMTFVKNGAPYYDFNSDEQKFKYYFCAFNSIFGGLEPSVKLSDNVELFSNYGLFIKFVPKSKRAETQGIDAVTLEKNDDAVVSIGLSGILFGLRYNL
ncbi:MAG: hypothetical protein JXA71_11465 [Chitinispirillaceae bacterium]|nr:hypothetical protein [Chitinispirillaceae bacterium]